MLRRISPQTRGHTFLAVQEPPKNRVISHDTVLSMQSNIAHLVHSKEELNATIAMKKITEAVPTISAQEIIQELQGLRIQFQAQLAQVDACLTRLNEYSPDNDYIDHLLLIKEFHSLCSTLNTLIPQYQRIINQIYQASEDIECFWVKNNFQKNVYEYQDAILAHLNTCLMHLGYKIVNNNDYVNFKSLISQLNKFIPIIKKTLIDKTSQEASKVIMVKQLSQLTRILTKEIVFRRKTMSPIEKYLVEKTCINGPLFTQVSRASSILEDLLIELAEKHAPNNDFEQLVEECRNGEYPELADWLETHLWSYVETERENLDESEYEEETSDLTNNLELERLYISP